MLTTLFLALLFTDVALEVEVARALAQATLPAASPQATLPGQATLPARELLPMPVEESPLRWWPTTDPQQHALYHGDVLLGQWDHSLGVYWQYNEYLRMWEQPINKLPSYAPPLPARKTSAVPALGQGYVPGTVRLFSRSASC